MKILFYSLALLVLGVRLHAQTFAPRTLDYGSGGHTGQYTSQAIINGCPAIAYFNESDSSLMFARNSAPDSSGSWSITTTQYIGYIGQYPSLAEVNGRPAISYFDNTNGVFKYVRALDPYGARWGSPVTLDRAPNAWENSSLMVVNGSPAVSYYGSKGDGSSSGILKYIRATDADGIAWGEMQVVDGTLGAGEFLSTAVVDGNPAISYYSGGSLCFVRASNVNGTSWNDPLFVESTGLFGSGAHASLAVVNGRPAIAYLGLAPNNQWALGFVRANDPDGEEWGPEVVLDDSSGDMGLNASLAIVNGNPAVAYYDDSNGDLKYMRALDADGTAWGSRVSLDYTGDVGAFASLTEVKGGPAISYYDTTHHHLRYARSADPSGGAWLKPVTVDDGVESGDVGQSNSQATVNGKPAIAYFDTTNGGLRYMAALDAAGTAWSPPVTIDGAADDGYVSLAIVDGRPAVGYIGSTGTVKFVRSVDTAGLHWGTPVQVDGTPSAHYDAKLAVISGMPAISYWDGDTRNLKYSRASDADGTIWAAPVLAVSSGGRNHSLAQVDGSPAISFADPSTGALIYVRAQNARGTQWSTVIIDGASNIGPAPSLAVIDGKPAIGYRDGTSRNLKYVRAKNADGSQWEMPILVDGAQDGGYFPSLAVINGNPAISYFHYENSAEIRFVRASQVDGASWDTPIIVDLLEYISSSCSLADINGVPAVSYYDQESGNLKWAISRTGANEPDISVYQGGLLNLGGSVDFGTTVVGVGASLNFTIVNSGTGPLSSLAVTEDGADPTDFAVSGLEGTSIPAGGSVTFTATFSPATGGAKSAMIHIVSNVNGIKNPFGITLTGQSLSFIQDSDGDGLSDASEFQMAELGFDWKVNQAALVDTYFASAGGAGLFTDSQIEDLNISTPLLQRDASGQFKLVIVLQKGTTLLPGGFQPFPLTGSQVTIDTQGNIEIHFTSPESVAFFRLYAR